MLVNNDFNQQSSVIFDEVVVPQDKRVGRVKVPASCVSSVSVSHVIRYELVNIEVTVLTVITQEEDILILSLYLGMTFEL